MCVVGGGFSLGFLTPFPFTSMHDAASGGPSEDVSRVARRLSGDRSFSVLADAAPCLVLGLTADGRVGYASRATAALPLEPAALVGRRLCDVVHPDDAARLPPMVPAGGDGAAALPWHGEVRLAAGERVALDLEGWDEELGAALAFLQPLRERADAPEEIQALAHRAAHATNNLIVIADARRPDCPLVWVNQHFLRATGYAAEEVLGQNCRFLQCRADGTRDADQEGLAELRAALRERRPAQVLLRNYRKDGTCFWNELYLTPLLDGDTGAVTHFVGVQNDVTGRVESERRLREERALRDALFESVPAMVGIAEVVGDAVVHREVNRHAERLLGVRLQDALGKTDHELGYTKKENAKWRAAFERTQGEGRPVSFETAFPWDSADEERTHALVVTVNRVAGAEPLFAYVVEDVTERQRLEQQRRLLHAAVEAAAESIVITDTELEEPGPRILFVNRAFTRMTGYAPEEVIGRTPRMLQGPLTERATLDRLRRQMKAGRVFRGEAVNYRKDGTPFILEWEVAPVRDADGRVVHFVSTQRDITERHRLQQHFLASTAREQAQTAHDLHDGLGQALAGAAFYAGSLERRAASGAAIGSGEIDELRQFVEEATVQARTIARGLYPVDVAEDGLMRSLQALADTAERTHALSVTLDYAPSLRIGPEERAAHLYRVVQEAVSNAARHASAERVTVTLRPDAAGAVVLTVEDDGAGITDEALEQQSGTGLHTLRHRAEQLGGMLEVERRPEGGTAVRLRFPALGPAGP